VSSKQKRIEKRAAFAELKSAYAALRKKGILDERYDAWFAEPLNNAHLAAIGTYHTHVPAFEALLAQQNGDLGTFYREIERLAALPPAERTQRLAALTAAR